MREGRWGRLAFGRVNALVPAVVTLVGVGCFLAGYRWVGAGIAAGAVLALVHAVVLSHRVEIAADQGDMAAALMVMQGGLMVTFLIVGVVTVILIKVAVALAVAAAGGFAFTQLALLAAFYLSTRHRIATGGNAS